MRADSKDTSDGVVPGVIEGIRTLASRLRPARIVPAVPPLSVTDDHGREIEIRPYRDADFAALVEMYEAFDPAQRAQGVPPTDPEGVREWVTEILGESDVLALHDGRVVGHVSFVPDGTGRHELAIFVHQDYQQAGVGSALLAAGLGDARQHGIDYVWLSVERCKRYQQRFYNRAGFRAVKPAGVAYRMTRTL